LPVVSRCIKAYLRFGGRGGVVGDAVGDDLECFESYSWVGVDVDLGSESGRMDSKSRGVGTEWKEAWSRRERARLQKRSCWAAGEDGRERGCEEIGRRCCTAIWDKVYILGFVFVGSTVYLRGGHIKDVGMTLSRAYGKNTSPGVSLLMSQKPPSEGGTLGPADPEYRTWIRRHQPATNFAKELKRTFRGYPGFFVPQRDRWGHHQRFEVVVG
jgi:hypothetical protein